MSGAAIGDGGAQGLTVAVEGCGHGDLDNIYATIGDVEVSA